MRLRIKYILFVSILHLVALVLAYFIFKENQVLFIVSEVFIIISIIISWQLYNQLIQPLNMLMQGTEAIKDRDFNIKFLATGKYEMDKLIQVYNEMIDQLRTERTKQEQQHFFLEKLIYTSPTGIMILDYEDTIKQINPRALLLLGLEEKDVIDRSVSAISHPVIHQVQLLRSGESKTVTFNGVNTNNQYEPKVVENIADLLEYFETGLAGAKADLAKATEEQLDETWTLRNGEQIYSVSRKAEVIRMSYCQTVHHRAQLGVFLRLLDIPIPGSYGPSADEGDM